MFDPPERSPERDAAILALLPSVGFDGWTIPTLRAAAGPDADLLFPGGITDMVDAYVDLGDRWMVEGAAALDLQAMRVPARVRAVIALRFQQQKDNREAIRRALSILALPGNAGLTVAITARTVDSVWFAAGDTSVDFSWYSKRAILAGVYGATLLYWLQDYSADDQDTLAFLDRRLAGVGRITQLRRRTDAFVQRMRRNRAA